MALSPCHLVLLTLLQWLLALLFVCCFFSHRMVTQYVTKTVERRVEVPYDVPYPVVCHPFWPFQLFF